MLNELKKQVMLWVKDTFEVLVTISVIIVVLRLGFGSQTLVPLVVVTSGSMLHLDEGWSIWLAGHGIGNDTLESFRFQKGFARGDMIFTVSPGKYGVFPETRLGDVVIYKRDLDHLNMFASTEPIIHRVVGVVSIEDYSVGNVSGTLDCISPDDVGDYVGMVRDCQSGGDCAYPDYPEGGDFNFYITKGDNNPGTDQCGFRGGISYPVNDRQLTARGWIRLPYIGWIKIIFNLLLKILFFWI
ncbi:MAG: hypothetical protein V1921_05250 [Candidatus Altiarchaeota archaeon]